MLKPLVDVSINQMVDWLLETKFTYNQVQDSAPALYVPFLLFKKKKCIEWSIQHIFIGVYVSAGYWFLKKRRDIWSFRHII